MNAQSTIVLFPAYIAILKKNFSGTKISIVCFQKGQVLIMEKEKQDLTKGPLGKQILLFSLPLILSNLLQVLFHMADVSIVGQFSGSIALGAVGSTATLVHLFTGALIGLSGGINVLIALHIGSKNKKSVRETSHSAIFFSFFVGILFLLFGSFFSEAILTAMNTKQELIADATLYLRIYFLGMPALAIFNCGNAIFSAGGDTKRPLRYLTISGLINIILNLFFVIVCNLSVAGVALASVISQYLSAILILIALCKSNEDYGLTFHDLHIRKEKLASIARIGIPAAMQNVIFQFANLFVQIGINSFDATIVAGNSAAANADALVYDVMAAFYTACGSFIGQNYGANNKKRILKSYFISLAYSFTAGLLLGVLLVIFGRSFLGLFTKDTAVIEAGMYRLTVMGLSYAISAFMDATIAASRGLGETLAPTLIVIMGSCVFRVIWIYTVFAYFHTVPSLYLLYCVSWSITAIAEIFYFTYLYRKNVKYAL